jgi:hypothetical protein
VGTAPLVGAVPAAGIPVDNHSELRCVPTARALAL